MIKQFQQTLTTTEELYSEAYKYQLLETYELLLTAIVEGGYELIPQTFNQDTYLENDKTIITLYAKGIKP